MLLAQIPPIVVGLLVAVFVLVSVMMMLIVLIQRPQGGGLSEAFGASSGGGNTAFGAKTGDALTIATITIFVLFIGMAIGLNYIVKPPRQTVGPAGEVVPAGVGTVPIDVQPIEAPPGTPAPGSASAPDPAPAAAPGSESAPDPAPGPEGEEPGQP